MGFGDWVRVGGAVSNAVLRNAGVLQGDVSLRFGQEVSAPGGPVMAFVRDIVDPCNTGYIETQMGLGGWGDSTDFRLIGMVTKVGGVYTTGSLCYGVSFSFTAASISQCLIFKSSLDGSSRTTIQTLNLGETISGEFPGGSRGVGFKWKLEAGIVTLSVFYGATLGTMTLLGTGTSSLFITGGVGAGFHSWYSGGEGTSIKYTTVDNITTKRLAA